MSLAIPEPDPIAEPTGPPSAPPRALPLAALAAGPEHDPDAARRLAAAARR